MKSSLSTREPSSNLCVLCVHVLVFLVVQDKAGSVHEGFSGAGGEGEAIGSRD